MEFHDKNKSFRLPKKLTLFSLDFLICDFLVNGINVHLPSQITLLSLRCVHHLPVSEHPVSLLHFNLPRNILLMILLSGGRPDIVVADDSTKISTKSVGDCLSAY